MTKFDYRCTQCAEMVEVEAKVGTAPDVDCVSCGAKMRRVISSSPVIYKASGFTKRT